MLIIWITPNILAITEAKNKSKSCLIKLSELNLNGYNILSSDMDLDPNSRGIVVYINNNYEYNVIECNTKLKECDSLVIKIKTDNKKELFLYIIYRSPNNTYDNNKTISRYNS